MHVPKKLGSPELLAAVAYFFQRCGLHRIHIWTVPRHNGGCVDRACHKRQTDMQWS